MYISHETMGMSRMRERKNHIAEGGERRRRGRDESRMEQEMRGPNFLGLIVTFDDDSSERMRESGESGFGGRVGVVQRSLLFSL